MKNAQSEIVIKRIFFELEKGGEGSGNFEHSGRPGLVGGSAVEGEGAGVQKLPNYKKVEAPYYAGARKWDKALVTAIVREEVSVSKEQARAALDYFVKEVYERDFSKKGLGSFVIDRVFQFAAKNKVFFDNDFSDLLSAVCDVGFTKDVAGYIIGRSSFYRASQEVRQRVIDSYKKVYNYESNFYNIGRNILGNAASSCWVFDKDAEVNDNQVRESIIEEWSLSSRSPLSQMVQRAVQEELGVVSPLWGGTWGESYGVDINKTVDNIPKVNMDRIREYVKKTYAETQDYLSKRFPELKEVKLYRGVKGEETVSSPLSSWTVSKNVAKDFDGHSIKEEVIPVENIFVCVGAPAWKGLETEQEYILIGKRK